MSKYLLPVLGFSVWVAAEAQIVVSSPTVDFGSFVQGQTVAGQTLTITSTDPWKATPGASWLTAAPKSGSAVVAHFESSSPMISSMVHSCSATLAATAGVVPRV